MFQIRFFGFLFAIFSVVLMQHYLRGFEYLRLSFWHGVPLFFLLGIFFPKMIKPIYGVWIRFGNLMGLVNSKIILTFLFYGVFSPVAFVLKMLRKDALKKKFHFGESYTYWEDTRKQTTGTMKQQF